MMVAVDIDTKCCWVLLTNSYESWCDWWSGMKVFWLLPTRNYLRAAGHQYSHDLGLVHAPETYIRGRLYAIRGRFMASDWYLIHFVWYSKDLSNGVFCLYFIDLCSYCMCFHWNVVVCVDVPLFLSTLYYFLLTCFWFLLIFVCFSLILLRCC